MVAVHGFVHAYPLVVEGEMVEILPAVAAVAAKRIVTAAQDVSIS
jgi:hypothetical protein